MSSPPRTDQDVAEDRRMFKLLAVALGATSVVICAMVIVIGHSLADQSVSSSLSPHSPVHTGSTERMVSSRNVATRLMPAQVDRQSIDITSHEPVELAAPWHQSATGQLAWRND